MVEEQKKLLEMLREIDTICRKHGIEYYLAGGTCIGAIRNKGFLPWDDDMDLYMTRKNWDKFMEVSKYDLPPDRVLLCPELVDTYSNTFGRYCDTTCTALHKHNIYVKHNEDDPCGAIVDILPLDPIPDASEEFIEEYAKKIALYAQLIMPTGGYVHRYLIEPFTYLKYAWKCLWNRKRVLKKMHEELFCYDEDECEYYAMRWGGTPLVFHKSWFQTPTERQFEDITAMMPTMNNAYLTMHYGDSWVMVPDKTEREGHVAVFRMDVPYVDFRKKYENVVKHNRRFYMRCFATFFHFYRLLTAKKKNHESKMVLMKEGEKLVSFMDLQSEQALEKLYALLEERKISEISTIVKPYMDEQLSAKYIGREDFSNILRFNHPVLIPVNDAFFEFFILFCMHSERIHYAFRMIQIKEKTDTLSEKLKEYREDILLFRDAVNDYDLKQYESSYQKAQKLSKKYNRWNALIKLQVRLFLYCDTGTMEEAGELLKLTREIFPEDGEFVRYQMNYDRKAGIEINLETLVDQNCEIMNTTRNGMVFLEIKEEMEVLFEDFYAKCCSLMENKEYTALSEWIAKGKKLYQDDYTEQLILLKTESDFFRLNEELERIDELQKARETEKTEGMEEIEAIEVTEIINQEIDKAVNKAVNKVINNARNTRFKQQDKILKKAKEQYKNAVNLKEKWEDLYIKLLLRCGYSAESASLMLQMDGCESYEELLAMKGLFDKEKVFVDLYMVYGDYLYALGKTSEAKMQYKYVLSNGDEDSLLYFCAKNKMKC